MPKKNKHPKIIHLSESTVTWGCHYQVPDEKKTHYHYGFSQLPSSASLWLECASGGAVEQIMEAGLGTVISTTPGAYGGTMRTVEVEVERLETHCRAYWDALNRAGAKHQERQASCHYCGAPSAGIGFFEEGVCKECGG